MTKLIGVSPTYLSKVERYEFAPPAEDKVKAIAQIVGCDVDELLARAGRLASALSDIIRRHSVELAALLRTTKDGRRRTSPGWPAARRGEGQVNARSGDDGFEDA